MIGVPAVWLQLASVTHRPRWRATLLDAAGDPLVDPLPIEGGTISKEENGNPRVEAEVFLPATPQWRLLDQAYLPTSNRLKIEFTIEGDGLKTTPPPSYRYPVQANPPDNPGEYNQFALVLQTNDADADGRDAAAAVEGATDLRVAVSSDGGSDIVTVPLVDRAGNGHLRWNGLGTDAVHTFSGPLTITVLSEPTVEDRTWVTMADLDVVDSAISRPDDMWTLHAVDRSARIDQDDLVRTTIPQFGGQTVESAIRQLVHRTFPGDEVLATGPAQTQLVPTKYGGDTVSGSPWDLAQVLAAEARSEVFYDTQRRVQIRPIPGVAATHADALDVGEQGQVTQYVVRHEMSVNTVVLRYINRNNNQQLRVAVAADRRPFSPNSVQRVGSHIVYGEILDAEDAPSQAEADAAAAALLTKQGKPRAAEMMHPTRPWLEPGDTVQVTFLGGPTEKQVVESVGIDMGHEGLQTTRLRNHDYLMNTEVP